MRFERVADTAVPFDFVARGAGYSVALSGTMARIALVEAPKTEGRITGRDVRSVTVDMRLAGAREEKHGVARQQLPGLTNHLIGNDPREWRTGVRGFGRVEYDRVYRGIDVAYYGNQRQLEYDFVVHPGADVRSISLEFDGAERTRIDEQGNLVIETSIGNLVQHAPVIYQEERGGARQRIAGGYVLRSGNTVGFRVKSYDRRRPLVIDPVLSYSTYLGGSGFDHAFAVALDRDSNMLVAGFTTSTNFPQAQSAAGGVDAFVAKLNATGNALLYATYLGGQQTDYVSDLEVDAQGNAFVAGTTESRNFPTLGAVQSVLNGFSDSFVAKLDAAGRFVYSTYLGGRHEEQGFGLAVDGSGRAYVTGSTRSPDFPIVNPLQSSTGGSPVWLTTDGGTVWNPVESGLASSIVSAIAIDPVNPSTVYAGTLEDGMFKSVDGGQTWTAINDGMFPVPVNAIAIDPSGRVYAGTDLGVLSSTDGGEHWAFPNGFFASVSSLAIDPSVPGTVYAGSTARNFNQPGVFKSTDGGLTWTSTGLVIDVFSLVISPAAPATIYAGTTHGVFRKVDTGDWTQLSSGFPHRIQVEALAIDSTNASIVYAATDSGLFKTTNGGALWSPTLMTGFPLFRIAIAPSDPSTLYISSFGGVLVTDDAAGTSWRIAGLSDLFVLALAVHPSQPATVYAGTQVMHDAFVARLNPAGSELEYSTYLGGGDFDYGSDVAVDAHGDAYVVGATRSIDFPVVNPAQAAFSGLQDLFVAKIASTGSLEYATYLGGSATEDGATIGVDAAGRAHVAAYTLSTNFPMVNAHQPVHGGGFVDIAVATLDSSGSALVYSTYLGGSGQDHEASGLVRLSSPALAVSPGGEAFVAGMTRSTDFPTVSAFQPAHAGGSSDAFVAKFGANGALEYSTYLGGSGADSARRVAVDIDGSAVVAGMTTSANFPTKDPLQPASGGSDDAFVARISAGAPDPNRPRTTFEFSGTAGSGGWYRGPVVVTLNATADPSTEGIRSIDYSVDRGPLQRYSGPFTISAEGATQLWARATTVSGTVESPAASAVVRIDTSLPALSIASPQPRDYLHTDVVTVGLSASDVTSGLSTGSPSAMLDGAPVVNGQSFAPLAVALGSHTVTASATDVAGNSTTKTVTFRVIATIDSLIAAVNLFVEQGSIDAQAQNGLMVKLNDAKQALDRGHANAARSKLRDFINQVNAQSGQGVASDAATLLRGDAEYVLGAM